MFDDELFEVEFERDSVLCISAIQYRISEGGVQEMKRRH